MKVKVAVCTYAPDLAKLSKVIAHILENKYPFDLILVENGISTDSCENLAIANSAKYINVETIGTAHARLAAMREVSVDDILIFVDDDNYIDSQYIELSARIHKKFPNIGIFSGELRLPNSYNVKSQFLSSLPYLAIRDLGPNTLISSPMLRWNLVEPPTAGAVLHGQLCKFVINEVDSGNKAFLEMGARGRRQLRGEDSYIARCCHKINLYWGYFPELKLTHDFGEKRLKYKYILKLLFWMGVSDVKLNRAFGVEPDYPYPTSSRENIKRLIYFIRDDKSSWTLIARSFGSYLASRFPFMNLN